MIGTLLLILIFIYLYNFYKNVKSLPPGPMPLPLIGNLYSIDMKKLHFWIFDQKKTYGSVYTIWIPTPQVVFADYDTCKESLVTNGDNFIGRNDGFPEKSFHEIPNIGVIMSEGDAWRDQRRLSIQILRNFGMSRTIIEDKIHLVIGTIMEHIESYQDQNTINIGKIIHLGVGNVINSILFGFMYNHKESENFYNFAHTLDETIKLNGTLEFKLLSLFPNIDKIPILNTLLYKRIMKAQRFLRHMNNIEIEKCKKTYKSDDEPPNFVHAVMKEIEKIDSRYSYLNSDHLQGMVLDFWIAGMETSTTTLKWFILLIMKHLDIQDKLHKEIDEVLGREQLPVLADRINMPYMSAFITEGQRYINMVPFVPSHKCTKDTIIGGHLIKAGTLTQPFFWGANYDEKYFKDPFVFNPDRFLENNILKVEYEHMAFGKGKRVCAGKSLADAEIFLFFTALLQKYKFT
uniref:Cytochrome P450 18a1 (inferred by orthology to a D. melanogaster protein) n=1 Tax=Parastrongyloides trichosuri TaxID=131310 RepID=A0A0N4ZIY1_PARTI